MLWHIVSQRGEHVAIIEQVQVELMHLSLAQLSLSNSCC